MNFPREVGFLVQQNGGRKSPRSREIWPSEESARGVFDLLGRRFDFYFRTSLLADLVMEGAYGNSLAGLHRDAN